MTLNKINKLHLTQKDRASNWLQNLDSGSLFDIKKGNTSHQLAGFPNAARSHNPQW